MTPFGARQSFKRLGISTSQAARLFGRCERVVFYWLAEDGAGPPEHISFALTEIEAGRLDQEPAKVREFVKRAYSRRDGDRYN